MAASSIPKNQTQFEQLIDLLTTYAIVTYPLIIGLTLIIGGYLLDFAGKNVEAGVTAATGILICAITFVIYVILWALGKFGY